MLSDLKILFRNLQNSLNDDTSQIWQDELSEAQLMKIDNAARDDQQDNEDCHDTKTLLYDWKAWHAVITIDESMIEQIHKNCDHLIIESDLNSLKEWKQYNNIVVIEYVKHLFQSIIQETCTHHKKSI